MKESNKQENSELIFIHSLFRAGSTYFYNTVKETNNFTIYHEPLHEIIKSLPKQWEELNSNTHNAKTTLRHEFLAGGYFDEFKGLLDKIDNIYDDSFSYKLYFLNEKLPAKALRLYIDTLFEHSGKIPVLQCTRTIGRIKWLKAKYSGQHLFLLRNPWDQWYSYQVDEYISSTIRIIYSQPRLPKVLKKVLTSCDFVKLKGNTLEDFIKSSSQHPISPKMDYCLFFGLWVYSFLVGAEECPLVINMDEISRSPTSRRETIQRLNEIGMSGLNLDNCSLHRTTFKDKEKEFYDQIQADILDIFKQDNTINSHFQQLTKYIEQEEKFSFIQKNQPHISKSILDDASRQREHFFELRSQKALLTASYNLTNEKLTNQEEFCKQLEKEVGESEDLINKTNEVVHDRNNYINHLKASITKSDLETTENIKVIHERNAFIKYLEDTLQDNHKSIESIENVVKEKNNYQNHLESSLSDLWERINTTESVVKERDIYITHLEQALHLQEVQTSDAVKSAKAVNTYQVHLESTINNLYERINETGIVVEKRDQYISHLETTLKHHESRNTDLEKIITDRDSFQAHLNTSNDELWERIRNTEKVVEERNIYITHLEKSLKEHQETVAKELKGFEEKILESNNHALSLSTDLSVLKETNLESNNYALSLSRDLSTLKEKNLKLQNLFQLKESQLQKALSELSFKSNENNDLIQTLDKMKKKLIIRLLFLLGLLK